jgi:hypothetical protein
MIVEEDGKFLVYTRRVVKQCCGDYAVAAPLQRWQMAAGRLPVQSDPTLLADIRRYGKFDPTGCYQCGSCTLSCDLVDGFRDLSPQEHSLRPAGTEAAARPKPGPLGLPRLRRLLDCLPASSRAQNLHAYAAALPQRAVRLDGHRSQAAPVYGVVHRFA